MNGTAARPQARRAVWILASAVMALATACSASPVSSDVEAQGSTPAASPSMTGSSTGSSSSADTVEHLATAAYLGMWQAMASAATTSDWRSPDLSKYATGDALQVITKSLYTDSRNGLVTKGAPKNSPSVSSVAPEARPTTVLIADCGDSTDWLKYRADNGQLADDTPGGRRAITAEVSKQSDGTWKVTRFAVQGVGSC